MHLRFVGSLPRLDPSALLDEARFVHRLAKALVRRADVADDVAQDVFVAALQQQGGPPRHLRGWLASITKRLARRSGTAERRRTTHEANAAPPAADDRERHTAERLQLQRRLCDAVEALPEPYRTAVTLRFFDELAPRAIAARTGTSSDVVRQRLHRGLAMLRQQLDGEFGDRRAWIGAFAAAGLGLQGSPWLLLTVLTMNKLALGAAAALAAGVFLIWPNAEPPPARETDTVSGAAASSAATAAAGPAAEASATELQRTAGAAPEPRCEVLVVGDDGAPVRDAAVHLWRVDEIESELRTDEHGRCSLEPSPNACMVLVCADGHFPHRAQLTHCRGEQRIELPAGESITGTLLVDGAVPRRSWGLWVDPVPLDDAVPDRVRKRLRTWRVPTAADGSFALRGLPTGWRGGLYLPRPLWLLPESGGTPDNHSSVAVDAATHDLRIATTQLPTMQWRVVWDDDGSPVVEPRGMAHCEFADGSSSPSMGVSGDRDGNLVTGFYTGQDTRYLLWCDPAKRPAIQSVTVRVHADGSDGSRDFVFTQQQIESSTPHVLRLARAKVTHFVAIDEAGAPIAGARIAASAISEPTGADGRGSFAGTAGDVQSIGAPEHRVGPCAPRAAAAGTADDPLVFVLPRSNAVHLRVVGADGKPPPHVRVELRSDAAVFTDGGLSSFLAQELGSPVWGSNATVVTLPDGTKTYQDCVNIVERLVDGRATVRSFVPGQPCAVVALDPMHRELARTTFTTPPANGEIAVDLLVPGTAREFRGRIVDAAGNGLAKATVELGPPGEENQREQALTDATGTFVVRGVYATEALRLKIDAPGFVAQQLDVPPLRSEDGDTERTFRLQPGLAVTVRVVDESGAPVAIPAHLDSEARLHDAYDDLGPGVRRWSRLPAATVTFHCTIGGVTFPIRHDPRQPEALLRVPKPGRLVFTAQGGWPAQPDGASLVAKVQRLDATAPPLPLWSPDTRGEEPLVPGRYRAELVVASRPTEGGDRIERPLGLTAEFTLTAGELTRAELRRPR